MARQSEAGRRRRPETATARRRSPRRSAACLRFHHLRIGRRRQVDAARPPAVRRPAWCSTTSWKRWIATAHASARRRRHRLRAAGRRPSAEREQGITIDVAYRYFRRAGALIAADTPGHEQYTRNMATGASTADVAIILVDARKGPAAADAPPFLHRVDARRAARDRRRQQDRPRRLRRKTCSGRSSATIARSPRASNSSRRTSFPVSARFGDNVVSPSENMPWRTGPSLLGLLETIEAAPAQDEIPFPCNG